MEEMGDRIDRAERYVLGRMSEHERERAERDLEIDPAFRTAMVETAERLHVFDGKPGQPDQAGTQARRDQWSLLKEAIAALPQMRPADAQPGTAGQRRETPERPATFGRRKTDWPKRVVAPPAASSAKRLGLHSTPDRKALALALCLIAAFALGYVVGRL